MFRDDRKACGGNGKHSPNCLPEQCLGGLLNRPLCFACAGRSFLSFSVLALLFMVGNQSEVAFHPATFDPLQVDMNKTFDGISGVHASAKTAAEMVKIQAEAKKK